MDHDHQIKSVEDTARVVAVENNEITFEMLNTGSCDSCSMNGLCATNSKQVLHKTESELSLKVDDIIKVSLSPGVKILSAFVLFLIPILSMILFYIVGKLTFGWKEDFAILFSLLGLLVSGVFIFFVDKKFSKKIHFEILEVIK